MAEFLINGDGDNKYLRDAIFQATPKAVEQTKTIAQRFKGATDMDTCRNIWNFLKSEIRYSADGWHQKIKLPSALLREKVGDCKSYSLFTASILQNLGIPWHYVLTSYSNDPTPSHIYVVCDNGTIVDAVWTDFNKEKKPVYRYKHKVNNNDMKISYIAGIPARRTKIRGCGAGCNCNPCQAKYGSGIGTAVFGRKGLQGVSTPMFSVPSKSFGDSKFMGIGRTGVDWLKAATGRVATAGETTEYFTKNTLFRIPRFLILEFIKHNGGGIANFMYNAWLRDSRLYLPNEQKYNDEALAIEKNLTAKYQLKVWNVPADALKKYQDAVASYQAKYPNATSTQVSANVKLLNFYTPAQLQAYNDVKTFNANILPNKEAERKTLMAKLDAKYPANTRYIDPATEKSKQKYRDIELMWFWKFGGSPDDLNDAVKQGNTISPRGKDANYMLMKAFKGTLKAADVGLIIRAFVSAFGGDKFNLGQDGTFVVGIAGNKNLGIGVEPTTTTGVIMANLPAILECITGLMGLLAGIGGGSGGDNTGSSSDGSGSADVLPQVPSATGGGSSGGGSSGGSGSGGGMDNTTLLLIGAALVGGFLIINK